MTDEEKAEEQCKKDFCTYCLSFGKCEKSIALCSKATNFCKSVLIEHLKKENAELKEKLRVDRQCEACKLGDLIVENARLKKESIKLRERLNSINKSNDEYEMMYRKSISEHNENIQLKAQIENMKNFYNCSHSSRALCPNEHKCNGCKDWELAE